MPAVMMISRERGSTSTFIKKRRRKETQTNAESPRWRLGGRGSCVASVAGPVETGVAEEARTRGFAAPAFAGCAFVEGWHFPVTARCGGCQGRSGKDPVPQGSRALAGTGTHVYGWRLPYTSPTPGRPVRVVHQVSRATSSDATTGSSVAASLGQPHAPACPGIGTRRFVLSQLPPTRMPPDLEVVCPTELGSPP
jgi:hypothetical protein